MGQLVEAHKWVALAALVIGLSVRVLKSDTKIPIDVPPRLRIWLAFGLGMVAAVLEKFGAGSDWKSALVDGLTAATVAIVGHNVVVDSIRGGRELVLPGLIKEGASPSPGKPPSIPPPAAEGKGDAS